MDVQRGIQIIITTGPEDAGRATIGFAAAVAACACGITVAVFLVLDGTRWALQSEGSSACTAGFEPISKLVEGILAAGGRIEVCPVCLNGACGTAPFGEGPSMLRPGVTFGGLAGVALLPTFLLAWR